jgi:hypothetical protein
MYECEFRNIAQTRKERMALFLYSFIVFFLLIDHKTSPLLFVVLTIYLYPSWSVSELWGQS